MKLHCAGLLFLIASFNLIAEAGEAHICASKVTLMEQQEQMSDDTIFKCAGIKSGKNTFTINELAQNNWQIISINESINVYKTINVKSEIYHQIVIQKP